MPPPAVTLDDQPVFRIGEVDPPIRWNQPRGLELERRFWKTGIPDQSEKTQLENTVGWHVILASILEQPPHPGGPGFPPSAEAGEEVGEVLQIDGSGGESSIQDPVEPPVAHESSQIDDCPLGVCRRQTPDRDDMIVRKVSQLMDIHTRKEIGM